MISALDLIARALGVIAIIQGLEFLIMRAPVERVWSWPDLEPELGRWLRFALAPNPFVYLNLFRILTGLAVLAAPHALGIWLLFFMHVLTLLRWLGTFNGGSDYMTLLLLWTCALGLSGPEEFGRVCLFYITFQLCFSYFKAGWIKIKNPRWRDGSALRGFLGSPIYASSWLTEMALSSRRTALIAGWAVFLFELSFPLSLLHPKAALFYMGMASAFHLANAYLFGLNRFFFSWVAAYPALYYVVSVGLR